jgi:glycine dehydrogenase subunit 1
MRFLPHTKNEVQSMLKEVGADSLDDLYSRVPKECRRDAPMSLPEPITEWELGEQMSTVVDMMQVQPDFKVLIGAGSYDHHIPAIVPALTSRSEFLTAYTPYQPEMAQGTLQGIFEYQTLTARLLGMDVANASIYDGASALAEALLMGIRISKKKKKVAISKAVHPHYRQVVETYFRPTEFEVVELPFQADGRTDLSGLAELDDLAAVAIQSPNFFGVVEDLAHAAEAIHDAQAICITCFTEPLAYGLVKNPGSCGVDIVCG